MTPAVTINAVMSTSRGFIDMPVAQPAVAAHEVLVKIEATAINPHDVKAMARLTGQQTSQYGFDAVGTIQKIGGAVQHFQVGQRVFYMGNDQRAGSFAEMQVVDERLVALAPQKGSLADSAGLPLASITAYELLFEKLGFTPVKDANHGQRLLVINGAGGVGSMVTQLANWAGLTVLATASVGHFDWLHHHGVTTPIDYHQSIADQLTHPVDATIILTHLATYLPIASQVTKPLGQIATVVTDGHPVDLKALFTKSQALLPEMVFSKFLPARTATNQGKILAFIRQCIDQNEVLPITTQVLTGGITAANLTQAATQLATSHTTGKIVITSKLQ